LIRLLLAHDSCALLNTCKGIFASNIHHLKPILIRSSVNLLRSP
jgi:hypothetical protein